MGSGLRLSICHLIINKHGGSISAQSEINRGTTFTIYLPASLTNKVEQPVQSQDDLVGDEPEAVIMVMDDDSMVREVAQQMLQQIGYIVILTENGQESIDVYKKYLEKNRPVDMIIMDLTVPGGMGGREAVREILKINPEAKVVVASGDSHDPVMVDFQDYGFYGSIIKPFHLSELSELIDFILEREQKIV